MPSFLLSLHMKRGGCLPTPTKESEINNIPNLGWRSRLVGWWVGGLEGWRVGGLEGWRVRGLVGSWVGGLVGWWVGGLPIKAI